MWAAVNEQGGTARRAQSKTIDIAGKTGTSQVVGRRQRRSEDELEADESLLPHSLFVSFAPRRNPEITVLVLVEHGDSGGKIAAPIGKRVIEHYFAEIRGPDDHSQRQPVQTAEWSVPHDHDADHAPVPEFTRRLAEAFAATGPASPGPADR
jgi:membrane peptidoglycan carboxypeptidase